MPPKDSPYLDHTGNIIIPFNADQNVSCSNAERINTGDYVMKEMLILLAVIAVWYALQAYILPKMGIST
jgi:hypothetical protein